MDSDNNATPKIGLILSGGGARAAYQVGVLKAIAQIVPRNSPLPFPILCGTSAGSINALTLAIHADKFRGGVKRLCYVWGNFHIDQVFKTDTPVLLSSSVRWLATMLLRGMGSKNPVALLDRSPLNELLRTYLPCEKIQESIDKSFLHALSITTSGYSSGQSVSFFQGASHLQAWQRVRRIGVPTKLTIDHLMASSAIPLVFAPVRIHREYFGDGSMRQTAPISPALHLGAERILVIGVRHQNQQQREKTFAPPSLAQIGGHVLNSIFLDALEADLERVERINQTLRLIPDHHLEEGNTVLRHVDVLTISPSQDISEIALKHVEQMPQRVRLMLRGIGALNQSGATLTSYLLFEEAFCKELIELGFNDAIRQQSQLRNFIAPAAHNPAIKQR